MSQDECIISQFKYKNIFDKVLPEMVSVCPPRIGMLLCFELEQIRDHIYYTNAPISIVNVISDLL